MTFWFDSPSSRARQNTLMATRVPRVECHGDASPGGSSSGQVQAIAISLVSILSVRGYRGWRVEKELSATQTYLQQRDNRNALLSLKRAVLLRPDNLEARRALASLLEETASSKRSFTGGSL